MVTGGRRVPGDRGRKRRQRARGASATHAPSGRSASRATTPANAARTPTRASAAPCSDCPTKLSSFVRVERIAETVVANVSAYDEHEHDQRQQRPRPGEPRREPCGSGGRRRPAGPWPTAAARPLRAAVRRSRRPAGRRACGRRAAPTARRARPPGSLRSDVCGGCCRRRRRRRRARRTRGASRAATASGHTVGGLRVASSQLERSRRPRTATAITAATSTSPIAPSPSTQTNPTGRLVPGAVVGRRSTVDSGRWPRARGSPVSGDVPSRAPGT